MRRDILDVEFHESTLDKRMTIRQWLRAMIHTLWVEQEGFSGKRPFGNSGWDQEPVSELIALGYIKGELDDDGYVDWFETGVYDKLMLEAIDRL